MAAAAFSPEIMTKIREVTAMNYTDQAIFYLNAFWQDAKPASEEAETVWQLVEAFIKEDHQKGKNGNELNPIQAFNVLQKRNQTLTALELKAQLRKVDIDANGEMALAEYLLFINERDVIKFVTNPQGEVDPALLKAVQDKLAALDAEFQDLQKKEVAAKKAEEDAKKAEAELRAAEEEAKVIAAEIKAQEDAKAAEIARLEALSTDQSVGIVKRNMAVQQLAAAKNEDPLPLRKAKLTQDAVVRRLAKATAAAEEATKAAAEAVEAVKKQLAVVQQQIAEVEQELKTLQAGSGAPKGFLWWQNRVLEDKKRSLPQRMW